MERPHFFKVQSGKITVCTDELIAESDRQKDLEKCVLIVLNINQSSIQFLSPCAQSASVYVLFRGKQSCIWP